MKFLSDIEVEEGLKDSDGSSGSNGQVLSSANNGTATEWIDAPSGTIGGSITDGQVAVGAPTANSIEGDDSLKYTGSSTQRFVVGDGTIAPSIFMDSLLGYGGAINFRVRTPNVSTLNKSEIRLDSNEYLQINSSEKIYLDGETNGVVITGNGQISVKEFANSTGPTHTAGFGTLWVDPNSGSANKLYYTDDVGTDYDLTAGGGGSIGGSITAGQVAFGDTTNDEITGNSTFTFVKSGTGSSAQTLLEVGDGDSSDNTSFGSVHITAKQVNDSTSRARFQLYSENNLRGYLQCSGTSSDVTLLSNANLVLSGDANVTIEPGSTNDITMASSSTSGVGIGTTAISKKLQVNGTIYSEQASGEVMIAGNSAYSTKYITIREGSNYAARWGLQAEDDIVTSGVMLMTSAKPMAFRSSTNIAFDSVSLSHLIIRASSTNGSANVGIGTDDPKSKLQVAGGVQISDDTDTASADKVGTFRYRTATIGSFDYSYVDMCMQTDTTTYEWVNIVTNRW